MSATEEQRHRERQWHLRRGQYLGEVSALCFLHLPPHIISLPFLLAGTGSEILVCDLATGYTVKSFEVFEGIRVHGIALLEQFTQQFSDSALAFKIAVYGERRVKLYELCVVETATGITGQLCCNFELTLIHALPKFSNWVLDVCFLKDGDTSSSLGSHCLAIGCSDNSIRFWDISTCHKISQIRCTDRCLLYSMRMWNGKAKSLQIASGTIYNEIVVWKVNFQNQPPVLSSPMGDCTNATADNGIKLCDQQHQTVHICRLIGHEGSIFRISWSSDGLKLVSVSDDRSARVWEVNARDDEIFNPEDVTNHLVGPVLFGHSARVWDCCISDHLFITAGEDCTCRVWGLDGMQLKVIKEHVGRGVWRCSYDPISSLLVTAGFDSAIKVHQLHQSSSKSSESTLEDLNERKEVFSVHVPNTSSHIGLMDSKSEYVRCLQFSCEESFYVGTNNGYLYYALLVDNREVRWTELIRVCEGAPIICMDLLSDCTNLSGSIRDWIAVGDGKGRTMIVHVVGDIWRPKVERTLSWSAEIERQLLGTYWCKSLGSRFIFTADPRGALKLWRLLNPLASNSQSLTRSYDACLIAEFISGFGLRIMCLDASFEQEVLVCGDIRGNILLFPLSSGMSADSYVASEEKISPLSYFKGAHGISSVCSISIARSSLGQVEICSTGQDGCICYLEHDRDQNRLDFMGMKVVKELSALRSVFCNANCRDDLERVQYAIGFASSDFVIWNLTAETEVVRVACGGWRRPHSYYVGNVPDLMNCFGFVKNEIIYIHRHWVHENKRKVSPQNLHLQFHGRELHSVCFIAGDLKLSLGENFSKSSWIATGCEDGTVRLTRYEPGFKNLWTSKLLGEHVGGSAVRSICSVSKVYTILLGPTLPIGSHRLKGTLENVENPFLLISVGAKRVVTAWKQKDMMRSKGEAQHGEAGSGDQFGSCGSSSSVASSSISFQWLSTDMPTRKNKNHEKLQNTEDGLEASTGGLLFPGNCKRELKPCLEDKCENDWRYLSVTAFLVKVLDSQISVCFIVVACSDATLTLRALLLPCRLWFDAATLTPLSSPVLALQHFIVSKNVPFDDNLLAGTLYIVISGSTDGSISFWDLTKVVVNFMQQISSLPLDDYVDFQKRPRTGRGSQGGRWWRSLGSHVLKKKTDDMHASNSHIQTGKPDNVSVSVTTVESSGRNVQNYVLHQTCEMLHSEQNADACTQVGNHASEEIADDSSRGACEIGPLHTLNNVHQSGVNCLYVSEIKDLSVSKYKSVYCVLSGGDDQALNLLKLDLTLESVSPNYKDSTENVHVATPLGRMEDCFHTSQAQIYSMRFLSLDKIMSAHSSAIKGVWTDGNWVFSTGLDQRVRFWIVDQKGKLIEHAHLVISVPEPEALDAQACGRNNYEIAIVGRGMQMVEFSASM